MIAFLLDISIISIGCCIVFIAINIKSKDKQDYKLKYARNLTSKTEEAKREQSEKEFKNIIYKINRAAENGLNKVTELDGISKEHEERLLKYNYKVEHRKYAEGNKTLSVISW